MPLPDLIEIVPLTKPVRAEITVPGSKSITNRALILAALANGEVTLEGALWSEDTQVMTDALVKLGFEVKVEKDPNEFCNRRITVKGQDGRIPSAGTTETPLELFVGNAGTAARFLAAMVCLGDGVYRLSGVPRMHERPQAELFKALRELGYRVDATNDKLPATIFGRDVFHRVPDPTKSKDGDAVERVPTTRSCTVSIEESSQFASALLLSAKRGGWGVKVTGDDDEEAPYVTMTERLVEVFPWSGGEFQVEPDASSGSYFWAAGRYLASCETEAAINQALKSLGRTLAVGESLPVAPFDKSSVSVCDWPTTDWQIDADLVKVCLAQIPSEISRKYDLGDSIMTVIALSPVWASASVRFVELGRLRVQECERVVALRTELTKCGAKAVEEGDTLTVFPAHLGELHGAEIETYNDHRMAMCFAILGLKVPGIKLKNPACVKKTFPNFFQKLATAPPNGLGVEIRDGRTGRNLEMEELFAD
jgi:3-phosphoshikimate 1-carboxyvinyltransferase